MILSSLSGFPDSFNFISYLPADWALKINLPADFELFL